MNKTWLIIKREYISRVKKKSFIITTLLAPISMILLIGIQVFFMTRGSGDKSIIIKDDSGMFVEQKGNAFQIKIPTDAQIKFQGTNSDLSVVLEEYDSKGYDGVLHIPKMTNLQNPPDPTYYSNQMLGPSARVSIEKRLTKTIKNKKIELAGLDKQTLENLETKINIKEMTGDEEGMETSSMIASAISFVMGFIMYMSIIIYGQMVMRGVMEEKTNRIVEVILSSVKPFQLMIGKIVGIGAVGLTQFLIWIISLVGISLLMNVFMAAFMDPAALQQMANGSANPAGLDAAAQMNPDEMQAVMTEVLAKLGSINWIFLGVAFIFYYLGGYLFYSSLFAAVGSAIGEDSTSSESQALVLPITMPIVITLFILMAIIENPNGSLAFWASIIPFSSSIIMPARIAFGLSPFSIDFILSVLFLILGFMGTTWVAAKIYRTGILMTGKKVGVKEIVKWVKR